MIGRTLLIAGALATLAGAVPADARVLGAEAAACAGDSGPAIRADIVGLKDRKGNLKLELWNATEDEFLKDDRDLRATGRFFHRVRTPTPPTGAVSLCIRVPRPGRYALLFTHDRDGKNKFNIWSDGAGFPSNRKLGRARPKLDQAVIQVGSGVSVLSIRAQYLRGLGGFGPVG